MLQDKTYFCIRPVRGATFGTGISAGIFNPEAFTCTTCTGTLVLVHLRFGRRIWSRKSCLCKPQLILEGWKNIWTTWENWVGKVIAHRRNNKAARCPKAYDLLRLLNTLLLECFEDSKETHLAWLDSASFDGSLLGS